MSRKTKENLLKYGGDSPAFSKSKGGGEVKKGQGVEKKEGPLSRERGS